MNKIDDILNSLQGQQPVITDGLALTDSIMARLDSHAALPDSPPALPVLEGSSVSSSRAREGAGTFKGRHLSSSLMHFAPSLTGRAGGESFMLSAVRIVLTMAAAWLVGLFIYQQLTDERALQGSASYVADLPQGQALKDAYLRSMQKERQQTLSYTFVKKYINEKR